MFTLFLMNQKGLAFLQSFVNTNDVSLIDTVVGAKDESVLNDYFKDIRALSESNKISFLDRKNLRFTDPTNSIAIAIGWRWIISSKSFPRIIVFHDSLLPKYRGFAPTVNALINGEKEIGVTALWASEQYDQGPILGQKSLKVNYPTTIEKAISALSSLYAELGMELVNGLIQEGDLKGMLQDESNASYSIWRDEEDYQIDWTADAKDIRRFIDAVGFPYQGASTFIDGLGKIRILEAEECFEYLHELIHPGKVFLKIDGQPLVICGKGSLLIKKMILDQDGSQIDLKNFRVRFK